MITPSRNSLRVCSAHSTKVAGVRRWETHASCRATRRARGIPIGLAVAVIAVIVLAFLVPHCAGAVQVALAATLVVSGLVLPAGGYRASRFVWITGLPAVVAVIVLALILIVALI